MKKTILLAAFLLGIMLMAATGLCLGRRCGGAPATAPPTRVTDTAWLTHTLKLTPEQTAQVQALDKEYQGTLSTACAAHCNARQAMRDGLLKPESDPARTRALLEAMAKAQVDSNLATLEHLRKIHALLNPAQQVTFAELVTRCICGDCPAGLHEGCK